MKRGARRPDGEAEISSNIRWTKDEHKRVTKAAQSSKPKTTFSEWVRQAARERLDRDEI
jgi:hypothetical protein